eukprot:326741-Amphidinium_carterae.1
MFVVSNTQKRILELTMEINEVLNDGTLVPARAGSSRGRLGFAASPLFGRIGRPALRRLAERQYQ